MDPRSVGPQIFPSAPQVRKRWEARLDRLPPPAPPEPERRHEAPEDREERDA